MSSVFVLCNLLQKWVCYACPKFWKFLPECTVLFQENAEIMNKYRPQLTTCGMYVVGSNGSRSGECWSGINRPYFSRPRKYRRLFSEPTYWPRRSRGQYGEGNNEAGIFEAEGNKSLIPGRLARSPPTCPSTRKVWDENTVSLCSERYSASTGSPWLCGPKWFDQLFSTCNRQLTDSPGG